ncbi:MAG: VWA domain-containing protein [Methylophilales bacterium]|nr:VWA domain-containing protein [Methylophilales bacterium]
MQKLADYLLHRRDSLLLTVSLLLLLLALIKPTLNLKHNIYSYLLILDISQSMNTQDKKLDGKPVSRIAYSQKVLSDLVTSMPCGTKVSIAPFAGVSISPLYTPIEVCANYAAIQDTIKHLEWRMAWSGNSRIRESMFSIARAVRAMPEPVQVVLFTDGEEAPKLHVFNTKKIEGFQGGNDWLLVGIGDLKGAAIPKYSEKNQLIGYWANESFALQPGIAQISEQNFGTRNESVAGGVEDRFVSKLAEEYLQELAKSVNAIYVRGDSLRAVQNAMQQQKPARRDVAPFQLDWILALLAGLVLLGAYVPKHPFTALKKSRIAARLKFR